MCVHMFACNECVCVRNVCVLLRGLQERFSVAQNITINFVLWEAIISNAPLMLYSVCSLESHITIPRDVSQYFPRA